MAAPIGNQFAAGHGRPRDLSREIARIREAAGHIDDLMGEAGSTCPWPKSRRHHGVVRLEPEQLAVRLRRELVHDAEMAPNGRQPACRR